MVFVISEDGTKIAYDRIGSGPVVVLVWGALGTKRAWSEPSLPSLLSTHFTVINYDRRGRGESTDTLPFSTKREIEDLEALIDAEGGSACIWGLSSGGALVLEAAAKIDKKISRLAVYEVPYNDEPNAKQAALKYSERLTKLLAVDDRKGAVELFMRRVGVPDQMLADMRNSAMWQGLEAIAPTLAYDNAFMGQDSSLPKDRLSTIKAPTLIIVGGASPPAMHNTAKELQESIPHADLRVLPGQTHDVNYEILAPMLIDFFSKK